MSESLQWYGALPIDKKIALKELSSAICGVRWEDFTLLFSGSERIKILYNKLVLEGFIQEMSNE